MQLDSTQGRGRAFSVCDRHQKNGEVPVMFYGLVGFFSGSIQTCVQDGDRVIGKLTYFWVSWPLIKVTF